MAMTNAQDVHTSSSLCWGNSSTGKSGQAWAIAQSPIPGGFSALGTLTYKGVAHKLLC